MKDTNLGLLIWIVFIGILFFVLGLILFNPMGGIYSCNKYCNQSYDWDTESYRDGWDTLFKCEDNDVGIRRWTEDIKDDRGWDVDTKLHKRVECI